MCCEVYLFDVPYHIDFPFDYSCGETISRGDIVRVPFGKTNRLRFGVVFRTKSESEGENVKPVHSVISDRFSFNEEMLGLCLFLKEYTLCTFGEAARTVLPPGAHSEKLNVKYSRSVTLDISAFDAKALLLETGRRGIRSEGQRTVIEYLIENGTASDDMLKELPSVTSAHIRALAERGVVRITDTVVNRNPYADYARVRDTSEIMLTRAQSAAYEKLEALYLENAPKAALLHGVTGSGKTKVIMKVIDKVIADGKSVIMMVPEISLTPQTVSIFCKRYGERVAVIHSSLSQGERLDA